jgi:3-oxoacyl-[acyl-carrier protein] reductase
MDLNLTGKTALVTAASGGIGKGVAEALADAGVRVAVSGRTRSSLEAVAETLASRAAARPVIVVGDVAPRTARPRSRRRLPQPSAVALTSL